MIRTIYLQSRDLIRGINIGVIMCNITVRFQIVPLALIMPRNPRLVCAGCEKAIDDSSSLRCSADLFRLFMSIRSLKRVEVGDPACRRCRYKFDNWLKKTKGDFCNLMETMKSESSLVSTILNDGSRNSYTNRFSFRSMTEIILFKMLMHFSPSKFP